MRGGAHGVSILGTGQPERVQHPDDFGSSLFDSTPEARAHVDRQFAAIVRGLEADDPRFVRQLTRPAPRGVGAASVMIVIGVVATVVLGIVPLALGVHAQVLALMIVGAVGCVLMPVATPLAVRRLLRHVRPLGP